MKHRMRKYAASRLLAFLTSWCHPGILPVPCTDGEPVMNNATFTNKHIGHRIRFARIGSRLAITELAERTGIPINQLEAFESDSDMVTAVELIEIATAMMLPVGYFLPNEVQESQVDQWRLIDSFRTLTPTQRTTLIQLVHGVQSGDAIAPDERPPQSPAIKKWPHWKLTRRSIE